MNPLPQMPDEFTIKKVPIGLLSSSVFTPDLPLRATQSTIGYFLAEKKSIADDSYGVHKSKYGGTGETNLILREHEQVTARKNNHLKTALHCSPEPPMAEKIMARRILDNKSFYAGPINKVACDVFQLYKASKPLPKPGVKQLFPRSVVYEIEYVKEQYHKAMMDALEKERREFEEIIKKQKISLQAGKLHDNNLRSDEQVEAMTALSEENEIIEDAVKKQNDIQDAVERNEAEEFQRTEEEETAPCTSLCGLCGCTLTRGACPKCNGKTEPKKAETILDEAFVKWKPEFPRYGSPWGERRQSEMMKVNYPFKTEAARWYYQSVRALDASMGYTSPKHRFPEKQLSSLNI